MATHAYSGEELAAKEEKLHAERAAAVREERAAGDRLEKTKRLSKEDGIERVGHLDAIRYQLLASDPARSRATS